MCANDGIFDRMTLKNKCMNKLETEKRRIIDENNLTNDGLRKKCGVLKGTVEKFVGPLERNLLLKLEEMKVDREIIVKLCCEIMTCC